MMELLTAALGGGPLSHEIVQADASGLDAGASKLFVAIDVGAFGDRAGFAARVDSLAAHLRGRASGPDALLPGERGWRTREEYERDGIPVHPAVVATLRAVGVELTGP
jgi:LDH2 family malate/lactate/ureidoglycolate dehydrogenase